MWLVSLRDLQWRRRRFLIAVVATALVFAMSLLMAGADAVQVGTATFFEPRAPMRVVDELERWCRRHRVTHVRDLRGAAHG